VQVQEELYEGEVLQAGEELHAEDPHEGDDKISLTFFYSNECFSACDNLTPNDKSDFSFNDVLELF